MSTVNDMGCVSFGKDKIYFSIPVYVDVCEDCVDLSFQLGEAGVDAMLRERTWNIKARGLAL